MITGSGYVDHLPQAGPKADSLGAGNGNVSVARWMVVKTEQQDFAEFYSGAADECLRTVAVSIGDLDTAQELVDEAFARAWSSWRTVSRHPAPKAWVVRTALNTGISRWRRANRWPAFARPPRLTRSSATATRCVRGGGEFPPRPQRSSWRAELPWA
jgi:hypothetical protein